VTGPALVQIDRREDEELVRRLATDDEFRARLARNPAGVLAEYHIEVPLTELPDEVVLPPRSQMAEALRAMTCGHLAPARASLPARAKFWPTLRLSLRSAAH
jgi:hypothetical protein